MTGECGDEQPTGQQGPHSAGDRLQKSPGLPLSRKLCYAIGGMPYPMTLNAKAFFMPIFLLDVVQITPFYVSIILFFGRAWDAITDPLVGYAVSKTSRTCIGKLILWSMTPFYVSIILFFGRAWDAITDPLVGYAVSKTSRTRIGKLIPWIVFSTPLGVISYIMVWYTPEDKMSAASSFCWFLIWNSLFDTFLSSLSQKKKHLQGMMLPPPSLIVGMVMLSTVTCYHVPYSSLNMFLGGSNRDRDSATGYRMGMELFATLLGAAVQGQIVGVYHTKKEHICSHLNDSEALNYSATLDPNFTSPLTDTLQNTKRAYLISALVIGACYFMCCIVLYIGVKEQLAPLSKLDRMQGAYLTGMKMIVKHTPYLWLVFGFLFCSVAFQITQGNFALFCTHVAGMGAYFQHLVLILLAVATLSVPLWQMLLVRLGKKTTIFIGLSIYIPSLIILSTVKNSFPVLAFAGILGGISLASLYLLPWSMLPDVVDDFKVKNPSCTDLEPMFYSCYVFFNKFGGGLSNGISTLVLYFVGYKPGACRHDPRVITTLQVIFAPVPIVLLLIGMVLFYFYPINEQRRQQIQNDLKKAVVENKEEAKQEVYL